MAKPDFKQGVRLFKAFNGRPPEQVDTVELKDYKELVYIGPCLAIEYLADDGYPYRHKFKAAARPDLCVSPDGLQLFLVGGNFKFTDRGITDR